VRADSAEPNAAQAAPIHAIEAAVARLVAMALSSRLDALTTAADRQAAAAVAMPLAPSSSWLARLRSLDPQARMTLAAPFVAQAAAEA
jgi:hypothetical protein